MFDVGRPLGMAAVDYTPTFAKSGELSAQRLEHSLKQTGGNVFMEDAGIVASYGIFGAPGSGKTWMLMYLLRQLLELHADQPDAKCGALILDPKAALVEDIEKIVKAAGRTDDLIVLNTDRMIAAGEKVNVIHTGLRPRELGQQLVMAAQAAGVATSDPFWILSWSNIFAAATYLLSLGEWTLTIKHIMDSILTVDRTVNPPIRPIERVARDIQERMGEFSEDEQQDAALAINQMAGFFQQENDNKATVEQIITKAYMDFQLSRYNVFSLRLSKEVAANTPNFYDQIIEDGKIVLVSLSPAEPTVAKTLCTLVKCLFQGSVLSRLARFQAKKLKNFKRPVAIACDEYSQVATELQGQPMGDGDFFSQSRQNGCLGLLATQSVNVLQASSLKENWKSIFSNFGGKIFLRLVDNETAEEAQKLAGEADWYLTSQGTSRGKDGLSSSRTTDMRERKTLPVSVMTQVFQKGDAVVLGSLDGSSSAARVRFLHVPKDLDTYKTLR